MRTRLSIALGVAALALGCSNEPTNAIQQVVEVTFTSESAPTSSADIAVTIGDNSLVLTRAELVVRRIKLAPDSAECDDHDDGGDHCVELTLGPVLATLPLGTPLNTSFSGMAPNADYHRVEFRVHQPSTQPGDTAFIIDHPDFSHSSIVVEGTYNGTPFQFTSSLDETIALSLDPPATVDGPHASVKVNVDVVSWFRNATGLIDPASGNVGGVHEALVRANILKSFTAVAGE